MNTLKIVVAGATGILGQKIVRELANRDASVTAIVRNNQSTEKLQNLQQLPGVAITQLDFNNQAELEQACHGAHCVISALSGLREVIIDTQLQLLNAAVNAGVPRFIPSDYSIDFTQIPPGRNRNLDMRREFHQFLDKAPIAATSIYNGGFTELLTGQAPFILFKIKRVLYWGNADQKMDFTTMDNVAAFTAAAALASTTPRSLHIAGDRIGAREMAAVVSEVSGTKFKLLCAGSLNVLSFIIKIARALNPAKDKLYPAWQGMQYMRDMFSGLVKVDRIDNDLYSGIEWKSIKDVLTGFLRGR